MKILALVGRWLFGGCGEKDTSLVIIIRGTRRLVRLPRTQGLLNVVTSGPLIIVRIYAS